MPNFVTLSACCSLRKKPEQKHPRKGGGWGEGPLNRITERPGPREIRAPPRPEDNQKCLGRGYITTNTVLSWEQTSVPERLQPREEQNLVVYTVVSVSSPGTTHTLRVRPLTRVLNFTVYVLWLYGLEAVSGGSIVVVARREVVVGGS